MKKVITLLLSLVLTFTTLFNYASFIVYADEEQPVLEEYAESYSETVEEEITEGLSAEKTTDETETIEVSNGSEIEETADETIGQVTDEPLEETGQTSDIKPAPNDITIESVDDQFIIRSDEDPEWLRGFAKETKWATIGEGDEDPSRYEDGSRIYLEENNKEIYCSLMNYDRIVNGISNYKGHFYDFVNDSVIIPKDIVYAYGLCSGNYKIELFVPGYEVAILNDYPLTSSVETSLPEVNVYYDKVEGLFIESKDEAWMEGVAKNDDAKWHIMLWRDFEEDGMYSYECKTFKNTDTYQIIDYDGNRVFVSNENLVNYGHVLEEGYKVLVFSNGYYTDFSIDDRYDFSGVKDFAGTRYEAHQNKNGDLIIESDDEDFLRALTVECGINPDMQIITTGGRVLFSDPRVISGDATKRSSINDSSMFINRHDKTKIVYDETNKCVVIKGKTLIENGLTTGTYNIHLAAAGYDYKLINNVAIDMDNITPSVPSNTSIDEDGDGNLVIYCDDTEWTNLLCMGPSSGTIEFYKNDTYLSSIVYGLEGVMFERTNGNKTVIVPNQMLFNSFIENGDYTVVIKANGYEDFISPLKITKGCIPVPTNLDITSKDDNIIISSTDPDFLSALVKESKNGTDENGNELHEINSYILLKSVDQDGNPDGKFSFRLSNEDGYDKGARTYSMRQYTLDGKDVVISDNVVRNMARIPSGKYEVTLFARGYSRAIKIVDIATSVRTDTPSKIGFEFDPAKGILITSDDADDADWLDAVAQGQVAFQGLSSYYNFAGTDSIKPLTRTGNSVLISLNAMLTKGMTSGDYAVTVYPNCYVRYNKGSIDRAENKVIDGLNVEIVSNGVSYTITFNANGGKGTMAKENAVSSIAQKLPKSQFTKTGNRFAGWSTVKNGSVEYSDEANISLFFEKTGNVTLYAVWVPIYVEKITVSGSEEVAAGKSVKLTAAVEPSDAANKNVLWTVEKAEYTDSTGTHVVDSAAELKTIATVSNGTVSAKKVANITKVTVVATAKDGSGIEGKHTVTIVPAVETVSIFYNGNDVSKKTIGIDPSKTKTITLSATTAPADASKSVTWTSSNNKVATVENGVVTIADGVSKATVKITAKATDGTNKNTVVTINIAKLVEKITVSGSEEVAAGKSVKLTAAVEPSDAANKNVLWTVEKAEYTDSTGTHVVDSAAELKTIATVSNGTVSAKKVANITKVTVVATAKDGSGIEGKHTVTIVPAVETVSIFYNGNDVSKKTIGIDPSKTKTITLSATTAPADASKSVTWTSSNNKVATVENGVVTIADGVSKATVKITAKATDGTNKNTVVTINIAKLVEKITVSGSEEVAAGKSVKLTAAVEPSDAANKNVLWTVEKAEYTDSTGTHVVDSAAELKTIATVSNGTVSAKKVANITKVTVVATAKDGSGIEGKHTVTIVPAVETVSIFYNGNDVSKKTIGIDPSKTKTITLSATTAPADASKSVTWTSSNNKVATVENGVVTIADGVSKATVKITAKATDGTNKNTVVTINIAKLVEKITVYNSKDTIKEDGTPKVVSGNARIKAGERTTLKAKVDPSDAANKAVSWSITKFYYDNDSYEEIVVEDPKEIAKYATISTSGVVTTKTLLNPEDKIVRYFVARATAKDGSGVYGDYRVRVYPVAESIAFYLNDKKLEAGTTVDLTDLPESERRVYAYMQPSGAMGGITISSSVPSIAYADEYEDIYFTGNKGTVTLTATSPVLKGVSVSVTFVIR